MYGIATYILRWARGSHRTSNGNNYTLPGDPFVPPRFNDVELIETYEFSDPNLSCKRNTTHATIYYRMYGMLGEGARVFTVL